MKITGIIFIFVCLIAATSNASLNTAVHDGTRFVCGKVTNLTVSSVSIQGSFASTPLGSPPSTYQIVNPLDRAAAEDALKEKATYCAEIKYWTVLASRVLREPMQFSSL